MRRNSTLTIIVLVVAALPAAAATIDVTTTNPGAAADGQCSLAEAIVNANLDGAAHNDCTPGSGADIIVLAAGATYLLDEVWATQVGPNGLPVVTSEITIEGNGSTIERAEAAPAFRLLMVTDAGTLDLVDVTLQNGDSGDTYCGGALLNGGGQAQLTRTTVTGSTAPNGGGICNAGVMVLTDCLVTLNTASGRGGGMHSLYEGSPSSLHLDRTLVTDNTGWFGAGVSTRDTDVVISDSTISGNLGSSSSFDHAFCGGLGIIRGSAEIHHSTITGNSSGSSADISSFGGGACISDNTTTVSNCTISGNQAIGPSSGGFMSGSGGGIMLIGGAFGETPTVDTLVIVEDSTICDNTAEVLGGGIAVGRYSGSMGVELQLRNTVVAENYESDGAVLGNCVEEAPAIISSSDYNLTDDSSCNTIAANDLVVADAMLTPLVHSGGPTATHLPVAGSPAIDSGDDANCPATDQRGHERPWDGDGDDIAHCDRGAVEVGTYVLFMDGFETGTTSAWSATVP
jgi:hypothetical protein